MKVTDVYDNHLAAIEEAERKVRIAKRRLLEAERELDETLELVETEVELREEYLNELFVKKYTLQAFDGTDWITVTKDFKLLAKNSKDNDQKSLDFDSWIDMKANPDFLDFVETAKEKNWGLRLLNGKNNKEYPIVLEPLECPALESQNVYHQLGMLRKGKKK